MTNESNFDAMVDDATAEPEPRDTTTERGALDSAVSYVGRSKEAQGHAKTIGDVLMQKMGVRREFGDDEVLGYADSYNRAHFDATAAAFMAADDAAVDREVRELRDRPDVKYFGPQAEYEVLRIWRDMFEGRQGQLEQAYRLWEQQTFATPARDKSKDKDRQSQAGALRAAAELVNPINERQRRYATPREKPALDPRKQGDALKGAIDFVKKATAR